MGRPKRSDLECTVCHSSFQKKIHLQRHMKFHSDIASKTKRTLSNWCHVCKKSFEDSEYKSHIQTEHQYDFPNSGAAAADLFSCENGYILLSKKRIKREFDRASSVDPEESPNKKLFDSQIQDFDIPVDDLKIEPAELPEEENIDEIPKKITKRKRLFIKCRRCGTRCKGQLGLKIHIGRVHGSKNKSSSDSSEDDILSESEEHKEQLESKQGQINNTQKNDDVPVLSSNNSLINLNLSTTHGNGNNPLVLYNNSLISLNPNTTQNSGGPLILLPNNNFVNLNSNTMQQNSSNPVVVPNSLISLNSNTAQANGSNPVALMNNNIINLNPNTIQENSSNQLPSISNSNPLNLNPDTRSGLLMLSPNNETSAENQLNLERVSSPIDSVKILEIIPKFDCNSEIYIRYLKKLISNCKTHKYPLSPIMCENINHVLDEIANAVGNPVGALRQKSNHFYFKKMHEILSEISMDHMKHSLSTEQNN